MKTVKHLSLISNILSISCCFHCLALPILIGLLPAAGIVFLKDSKTEILCLLLQIVIGFTSLCFGYKKHNRLTPAVIMTVGVFCFYYQHNFKYHLVFASLAAICFIASNLLNRRLCQTCTKCEHH